MTKAYMIFGREDNDWFFYPQSFATRREAEEKFSELETSGKWNTDEHYIAEGMKRKDVESD